MNAVSERDPKLRGLLESADRALSKGNHERAALVLAEAQAVAPEHPQVLTALGTLALQRGDPMSARQHMERAVEVQPQNPSLWLNLASAYRAQSDGKGEMLALDQALMIDPKFVLALLQKAMLFERQGQRPQAARAFQAFLSCIPPATQQSPHLRAAIDHAHTAVENNRAAFDVFLQERTAQLRKEYVDSRQDRFDDCIDALLGKKRFYAPQPSFMHFPRLPAVQFFERADFPWLDGIEAAAGEIRTEVERLLATASDEFVPRITLPAGVPLKQWGELNPSQHWAAFYLFHDGAPVDEHLARCPKTREVLESASFCDIPGTAPCAYFSLLQPRTRIPPQCGATNARLVVHIPLIVPPDCGLRVGFDTREWQFAQGLVYDETIEHEAWNESNETCAILAFDIWNPYLTGAERELVRTATLAFQEFYGDESSAAAKTPKTI